MRLFLLSLFLIVFSVPAMAQDLLREHREDDPTARLLEGEAEGPKTVDDYTTLYYERCVAANDQDSLKEYVETQCGCTAGLMATDMKLKDLKALFTKGEESNFQMARVMLLAYIPCMYNSVSEYVFDGCYYAKEEGAKMIRKRKVCECYGKKMGNYVAEKGQVLVPGFRRGSFNQNKMEPNTLGYIISQDFFDQHAQFEFEQCVMTESYNWDK